MVMRDESELSQISYPTYKAFSKEVLSGFEFDSLDLVEATADIMDRLEADTSAQTEVEATMANLSLREQRMIALEYILQNGLEAKTTVFGIPVRIIPVFEADQPPEEGNDNGGGGGGPDGGDREPRSPLQPIGSTAAEAEPEPASQTPEAPEQHLTTIGGK